MRSSTPPWPGSRLAAVLGADGTFHQRLEQIAHHAQGRQHQQAQDGERPAQARRCPNVRKQAGAIHGQRRRRQSSQPKASSKTPTMPPGTPSQLLPGLIAGASLRRPEGPTREVGGDVGHPDQTEADSRKFTDSALRLPRHHANPAGTSHQTDEIAQWRGQPQPPRGTPRMSAAHPAARWRTPGSTDRRASPAAAEMNERHRPQYLKPRERRPRSICPLSRPHSQPARSGPGPPGHRTSADLPPTRRASRIANSSSAVITRCFSMADGFLAASRRRQTAVPIAVGIDGGVQFPFTEVGPEAIGEIRTRCTPPARAGSC
jgi:hypothetical protein